MVTTTDWNPAWAWAAGSMISTLDDMRVRAPTLATGRLLSPAMQAQRLRRVPAPPGAAYPSLDTSAVLATAITSVISSDHLYEHVPH